MTESGMERAAQARAERPRLHIGPFSAQSALVVLYVVLALSALGALAFTVHATPSIPIDVSVAQAATANDPTWWDSLMRFVSGPGYPPEVYVLIVAIFAALWAVGLRWEAMAHAFGVIGIGVFGLVVKIPVDRLRPAPPLTHPWHNALDGGKMSFTAGHVESYIVIFGFLIFLLAILGRPSFLRTVAIAFFALMILLIGPARVYSGEHWFTDVIGGYLLGSVWLIATIAFYRWGRGRFFRHEPAREDAEGAGT